MDSEIVKAKLESLLRCIRRIEEKRPASPEVLDTDIDTQDIIILNLERAVQLCVDMGSHILLDYSVPSPDSMASVFLTMGKLGLLDPSLSERLAKSAGFRNIAVHAYESIDWRIVYSIITINIEDFIAFGRRIATLLETASGS